MNGQLQRLNQKFLGIRRCYVSYHPKTCNLFNGFYTCVQHSSTQNFWCNPFELVLSLTPHPVAFEEHPTLDIFISPKAYRDEWKTWLTKLITLATILMACSHAIYKREIDPHLSQTPPAIVKDEYLFIHKEYWNPDKEELYKLLPVADGPFNVVFIAPDTSFIDMNGNHERIPRDLVVLGPPPSNAQPSSTSTLATVDSVITKHTVACRLSGLENSTRRLSDLPKFRNLTHKASLLVLMSPLLHYFSQTFKLSLRRDRCLAILFPQHHLLDHMSHGLVAQ